MARSLLSRISRACRDSRRFKLRKNLDDLRRFRVHQHQVHAEGLVRQLLSSEYGFPYLRRRHVAGCDNSESSGFGDCRRKFRRRDSSHSPLKHRILYM